MGVNVNELAAFSFHYLSVAESTDGGGRVARGEDVLSYNSMCARRGTLSIDLLK